jgi:hypothetical protein
MSGMNAHVTSLAWGRPANAEITAGSTFCPTLRTMSP